MEDEEERERKKPKMEEAEEKTEQEDRQNEEDQEGKQEEHGEVMDCEQNSNSSRRKTSYYCKTCSGEPSLCPVPCFELYHTKLIYRAVPELETQGESSA